MTFGQAFKFVYRESWAFVLACPLLALIPFAAEMLQHVVEVKLGMYQSLENAKAMDADPTRMGFGLVKIVALVLMQYWVTRFIVFGRDAGRTVRLEPAAVKTFLPYLAFSAVLAALQLLVLPRSGVMLALSLGLTAVLAPLLAAWAVAAAIGDARVGPLGSIRRLAPHLLWIVVFNIAAILPLMIPHYALAAAALLGPKALLWLVLSVDALLASWMAALLVAINYALSRRAGYPPAA